MTSTSSSPDQGVPPGKGLPESPAPTIPAESARMTPDKNQPGRETKSVVTPLLKKTSIEEPEMALEPDLPSDGRDEKGEAMIRDLPQRPELSEPPSQPNPSSNPS